MVVLIVNNEAEKDESGHSRNDGKKSFNFGGCRHTCVVMVSVHFLSPLISSLCGHRVMESHDEMGCQAPERPILCINNCGFFGRAATMNMCSKCYKDMLMKQEQDKLAATSVENIVNACSNGNGKQAMTAGAVGVQVGTVEVKKVSVEVSADSSSGESLEVKAKTGPSRCATCQKRVGLTGFSCKCGNVFCAMHRYSDKHDCPFDYRTVGQEAIAKANPVVKADKLDKI